MKQLFTSLFLCLFLLHLAAQITIERSDYTLTLNETSYAFPSTNNELVTIPVNGENLIWDYSNITFSIPDSFARHAALEGSDALVPEANSIVSRFNLSNLLPGLVRYETFYQVLDQQGFRTIARHSDPTDYPIGAITGNPLDSLNFLATLSLYDDPSVFSEFPMIFGSSPELKLINLDSDFLLTASPFGLDHVPGLYRGGLEIERKISGWGTLIVNEPKTGTTLELEVLQVERRRISIDSIFLAGMPAPPSLMDAFGLAQGSRDTIYQFEFWTKGLPGPAFVVAEIGNSLVANINTELSALVSSTGTVSENLLAVDVFPNPNQGDFYLKIEQNASQSLVFDLYNSIGQKIHQQNIFGGAGATNTLITPATKSYGMHHFTLRNEDGIIIRSGKILLN